MTPPQGDLAGETVTLQVSLSASVRSLPGEKPFPSSHAPQEAFDLEKFASLDIPIMPMVIRTHFVNNLTGEGVASVRKSLYKVLQKCRIINKNLSSTCV